MVEPERRHFDAVFGGSLSFDELHDRYYPRVRSMLGLSRMPIDIYDSEPFTHSRAWDAQVRAAGYTPEPLESIFKWDVLRDELAGRSRPSATEARSNLGNSNGAKFDLGQNYLRYAENTGRAAIFAGHQVDAIAAEPGGGYSVALRKLDPTGAVLSTRTITCDQLFLAAGSIGTSELLVRARETGALPNLNEHVGQNWGTNGDVALARGVTSLAGGTGGVPCASKIVDDSGLPTTLENWYIPGIPVDVGALASLGMVIEPTRGHFQHDAQTGRVGVVWPQNGSDNAVAAARAVNDRVQERSGSLFDYQPIGYDANASFTAHPLGGAVLGAATDSHGRVVGHRGLYVMDGALLPGSSAAVNPSLTIAAIAERNIEAIVGNGG